MRLLGFADSEQVSLRADVSVGVAEEILLDCEAFGWVSRSAFAGTTGWSLTDRGRAENERLLAQEIHPQARAILQEVHRCFLPLNGQFLTEITAWQLGDHADEHIDALSAITRSVYPLIEMAQEPVPRFGLYRQRLGLAMSMARVGRTEWVDGTAVDSLHRVWFELHEDLIACLGLTR